MVSACYFFNFDDHALETERRSIRSKKIGWNFNEKYDQWGRNDENEKSMHPRPNSVQNILFKQKAGEFITCFP